MTTATRLPALALGVAELGVADLERSVSFYEQAVGLRRAGDTGAAVELGGEGGPALLRLVETPGLRPKPRAAAGLFHVALLAPSRRDLAVALARLERVGALTGAADHLVSEAIYLDDPDGNGLEIYRDRPEGEWPRQDGRVRMANDPLDRAGLHAMLAPAEPLDAPVPASARVGHIHLQAGDLDEAKAFWIDAVGLDLVTIFPGAAFMSAGGYHHHVAANVWSSRGRPPADERHAGLRSIDVALPSEADVAALAGRLDVAGIAYGRMGPALSVREPSGATVRFCVR